MWDNLSKGPKYLQISPLFDKLSDIELKDEIECSFDKETLDELVDNVTNETTEVK